MARRPESQGYQDGRDQGTHCLQPQGHAGSILPLGVDATALPGSGLPGSRTGSVPPPKQLIVELEGGGPGPEGGAHSL